MERSFEKEVQLLKLGGGERFHGEGILAVTKAMLQSGVSYVGGYQGAPVSHMMDVLADAGDILDDLGVHAEVCANEAGAAAMLGASINYPLRGAVTWKSVVGTNVASDALSNLASAGVKGGVVIVVGEDYGEGASIIQERTHAFAMKSQIWLLDPRPSLPKMVDMVEHGFRLSEASHTPVMLELRIRACHLHGSFEASDNQRPEYSRNNALPGPDFDYSRICLPPATYAQERHKIETRAPAALDYVRENHLNEVFPGDLEDIGIIVQGGHYNAALRALERVGLADAYGESRVPIYCLNVTYPLITEEFHQFCAGKRAVLVVEEGQPDYIEQATHVFLRKADLQTTVVGKAVLPMAGEYTADVVLQGVTSFLEAHAPRGVDAEAVAAPLAAVRALQARAAKALGAPVPARPPGFCVGCPERPVFSAMKLVEKQTGPFHVSADIGCHTFAALPPFNIGNTVMGYGLGLASSAGVAPAFGDKRVVSIMGDGGFWHNGLTSGVANAVFNKDDGVLIIMKNGYTSATGAQHIPSTGTNAKLQPVDMDITKALKGVGVTWVKSVYTYKVGHMVKTLREAMTTTTKGLKVIIADAECMLAVQRRKRPLERRMLQEGKRVVRTRYGVDEEVCTGDHACIRLSGCPTLTIKPSGDPLKTQPVAHVENGCVGCGLCGEVAHAAALCPSFYRADIVQNANRFERWLERVNDRLLDWLLARRAGA